MTPASSDIKGKNDGTCAQSECDGGTQRDTLLSELYVVRLHQKRMRSQLTVAIAIPGGSIWNQSQSWLWMTCDWICSNYLKRIPSLNGQHSLNSAPFWLPEKERDQCWPWLHASQIWGELLCVINLVLLRKIEGPVGHTIKIIIYLLASPLRINQPMEKGHLWNLCSSVRQLFASRSLSEPLYLMRPRYHISRIPHDFNTKSKKRWKYMEITVLSRVDDPKMWTLTLALSKKKPITTPAVKPRYPSDTSDILPEVLRQETVRWFWQHSW